MDTTYLKFYGSLSLADNIFWNIAAEDPCGDTIAKILAKTMQLNLASQACQQQLIIKNGLSSRSKSLASRFSFCTDNLDNPAKTVLCQLPPAENNDELALQLMKLSLVFCNQAETLGGLLIHGALAEKNGHGIILAGHGDAGKTTASRRLPPPWKSLSDDCTLIVRDRKGSYLAHPWPTWSTFMYGGTGGSWDVQYNVPLQAIFVLKQSLADQVEPLGQGRAVCLLNETAGQAWYALENDLDDQQRQTMSLQRFSNICELTKNIPAFLLHISKTGSFWQEIDTVLTPCQLKGC
jgi:SynChlorMet cassette protein ScmC